MRAFASSRLLDLAGCGFLPRVFLDSTILGGAGGISTLGGKSFFSITCNLCSSSVNASSFASITVISEVDLSLSRQTCSLCVASVVGRSFASIPGKAGSVKLCFITSFSEVNCSLFSDISPSLYLLDDHWRYFSSP